MQLRGCPFLWALIATKISAETFCPPNHMLEKVTTKQGQCAAIYGCVHEDSGGLSYGSSADSQDSCSIKLVALDCPQELPKGDEEGLVSNCDSSVLEFRPNGSIKHVCCSDSKSESQQLDLPQQRLSQESQEKTLGIEEPLGAPARGEPMLNDGFGWLTESVLHWAEGNSPPTEFEQFRLQQAENTDAAFEDEWEDYDEWEEDDEEQANAVEQEPSSEHLKLQHDENSEITVDEEWNIEEGEGEEGEGEEEIAGEEEEETAGEEEEEETAGEEEEDIAGDEKAEIAEGEDKDASAAALSDDMEPAAEPATNEIDKTEM